MLLVLVESCSRAKDRRAENLLVTRNAIKKVCVFHRARAFRADESDGVGTCVHADTRLCHVDSRDIQCDRRLYLQLLRQSEGRRVYQIFIPIDDP